jgi:hypothetical protein
VAYLLAINFDLRLVAKAKCDLIAIADDDRAVRNVAFDLNRTLVHWLLDPPIFNIKCDATRLQIQPDYAYTLIPLDIFASAPYNPPRQPKLASENEHFRR